MDSTGAAQRVYNDQWIPARPPSRLAAFPKMSKSSIPVYLPSSPKMEQGRFTKSENRVAGLGGNMLRDQRGVTGLETAIVLIAFVVVASVFAFAVLSTGLTTSEKSKSVILGGLDETSATLVLHGSVVAIKSATSSTIASVRFHATSASKAGTSINLSSSGPTATIVTYIDADNSFNSGDWTATWLSGTGPLLDPGETVEINVPLASLTTPLGTSKAFSIELKPGLGPVLTVARTTPYELTPVNNLN